MQHIDLLHTHTHTEYDFGHQISGKLYSEGAFGQYNAEGVDPATVLPTDNRFYRRMKM